MLGIFPVLTETPGEVKWAGPKLGSYNDEIYKNILGMTDEEIAGLKERLFKELLGTYCKTIFMTAKQT